MKEYLELKDLRVYQLSRELSHKSWIIYKELDWKNQKIMGDQFIRSADSVGANIAEGYSRYHFLDKIRFYLNARASLSECGDHWLELLYERDLIDQEAFQEFQQLHKNLEIKLNNFITVIRKKAKK